MKFLEKDLERIIFETDNNILENKGLLLNGTPKRQLDIGKYGIADLVYFNRNYEFDGVNVIPYLDINIVELKKEKIGLSAFLQSVGYAKGIKRYLHERKVKFKYKLHLTLIGSKIDKSGNFIFISDLINNQGLYNYKSICNVNYYLYYFDVYGIHFELQEDFKYTDERFNLGGNND